jgi:protein-tyrosine kinase
MSTVLGLRSPSPTALAGQKASAGPAERAQDAFGAEQYRTLRHIVEQFGKRDRHVIAISSPIAGDGKTLTSINLARALAQAADVRVLLVDADLRRGSVGEELGIGRAGTLGLAGAIADPGCRLASVVRRLPGSNLWVLPAGVCPSMPYEALRSPRVGELLKEARESYDYILVDTPPVVPVADMRVLGEWVDGFFLVVSAHRTPRALLDEALSAMDPDKVLGIVYNGDDRPLSRRYRYYYSYGQPEAPGFFASILGAGNRR